MRTEWNGANLRLHLGQQIELLHNEVFGVPFEGVEKRGVGVIRYRHGRITARKSCLPAPQGRGSERESGTIVVVA